MSKGRRRQRIAPCVTLAAVAAGLVSAGLPASAPAVPGFNRCYVALRNDTHMTWRTEIYSVPLHWVEFTIPNEPQWWSLHHSLPSHDDIPPGKLSPLFDVYGTPLSLGCHFSMQWASLTAQGDVYCTIDGWSWGANSLRCINDGLASRIQDEVDKAGEIGGTVVGTGPPGAATGASSPPSTGVKAASSPLRMADLRGRGWRAATRGETTQLIRILGSVKLPRSCESRNSGRRVSYQPSSAASWLFLRSHRGEQLITGGAATFARSVQAREAQLSSLSAAGVRCLARGISALKGISTASQRLILGRIGEGSSAFRIVIRERAARSPDYLDLVSVRNGRGLAVIGFYAENQPMTSAIERAGARAVAARISGGSLG